ADTGGQQCPVCSLARCGTEARFDRVTRASSSEPTPRAHRRAAHDQDEEPLSLVVLPGPTLALWPGMTRGRFVHPQRGLQVPARALAFGALLIGPASCSLLMGDLADPIDGPAVATSGKGAGSGVAAAAGRWVDTSGGNGNHAAAGTTTSAGGKGSGSSS